MIKIKQRKICGDCKANENNTCALFYDQKHLTNGYWIANSIPLEPCPKPLSTKLFSECLTYYKKPTNKLT